MNRRPSTSGALSTEARSERQRRVVEEARTLADQHGEHYRPDTIPITIILRRLMRATDLHGYEALSVAMGLERLTVFGWMLRGHLDLNIIAHAFPGIDLTSILAMSCTLDHDEDRKRISNLDKAAALERDVTPTAHTHEVSSSVMENVDAIRKDVETMATMLAATFILLSKNR